MGLSNVEIPGSVGKRTREFVDGLTTVGPDTRKAVASRQAAVRKVEEEASIQSRSIEAVYNDAVRKAQNVYLGTVARPERVRIDAAYKEAISEAERVFKEAVSLADGYSKSVQDGRQGKLDEIEARRKAAHEAALLQRDAAKRTAYSRQNQAWHEAQAAYDTVKNDPQSSPSAKERAKDKNEDRGERLKRARNRELARNEKKKLQDDEIADNSATAERKQVDANIAAARRECEQIKAEAKEIKEATVEAAGITSRRDVARLENRLRKLRKQLPQMDLDDTNPEESALKHALEEAEAARRAAMNELITQKKSKIEVANEAYDTEMRKIGKERSQKAEASITVGEVSDAFLNASQQQVLSALHQVGVAITTSGQVLKEGWQAGAFLSVQTAVAAGLGVLVSPVLVESLPLVPIILGTGAAATLIVGGYKYIVNNK